MTASTATPASTPLEQDAADVNERLRLGDVAIGVVIGRTSEFFDFFVYAIASVLVFPSYVFPYVDRLTGTLYSFAIFALAFVARPFGTLLFMALDRRYGRAAKLTIALFLLGFSTMAMAFIPSHDQLGAVSVWLLALFRIGQGVALGGVWDGLPALLTLNAPHGQRGRYAMIPQLGAPLGLMVACGLFAFFAAVLEPADFLAWGWRYPFFVAFAINVVALFARLRLVATPQFQQAFESRELQPARVRETLRAEGRVIVLGAFAPLASFALFHLVTVFPLSWAILFARESPERFLVIEAACAVVGLIAILASGVIADRIGRRRLLGISAGLIGVFACVAPGLLDAGGAGEIAYMLVGFALLGLSFGQSSGAVNAAFSPQRRYTGAAFVSDLAWLLGAGFAPLAALFLASELGPWAIAAYLLSGVACTLAALRINREWAAQRG